MARGPPEYGRQQSDWSSTSKATTSAAGAYGAPSRDVGFAATDGHVLPSHRPAAPGSSRNAAANGRAGLPNVRTDVYNTNGAPYAGGQALGPQTSATSTGARRNLTRAKTLTRPDRHVQPAPLINPHSAPGVAASAASTARATPSWFQPWSFYIQVVTFWAPGAILSAFGMKSKIQQQAWKEKVALCSIALILGGIVGFATIGLNRTLCPADQNNQENDFIRLGEQAGNDYKELQTQS